MNGYIHYLAYYIPTLIQTLMKQDYFLLSQQVNVSTFNVCLEQITTVEFGVLYESAFTQ